jgi:hypothetical protein
MSLTAGQRRLQQRHKPQRRIVCHLIGSLLRHDEFTITEARFLL